MKESTKLSLSIFAVLLSICLIAPLIAMYWHNMAHTIAMHDLSLKLSEQKIEGKIVKNRQKQIRATTRVYREQLDLLQQRLGSTENINNFLKK